MSVKEQIKIQCPKCKMIRDIDVWQLINVTKDSELRKDVFSQKIFFFDCKECDEKIFILYPFIYHDEKRKFFIYYNPDSDFEEIIEEKEYKIKKTSDYLELLEFIRIFEDEISEEKVNGVKEELFNKFSVSKELKNIRKVYYSGKEGERLSFYLPEIKGKITV